MKIALAQIAPKLPDRAGTTTKIVQGIRDAAPYVPSPQTTVTAFSTVV